MITVIHVYLFTNYISKINNTQIDNAECIDIVMPMYNLIEYSNNYSKTFERLWQHCKEIPAVNDNADFVAFRAANATESFNFKTKTTGRTGENGINNVEIMLPLRNFWRTLEMPLINFEVEVILTWSADCVIFYTDVANQGPTITIIETNLYVPVVTLSTQDNATLLRHLKSGFKWAISWNEYLPKPELLVQSANLNLLIEPSFQGINKLFVLAFEDDAQIISNKKHHVPNVEIKNHNVMIAGKNLFHQLVKNDKVTYENI